MGNNDLTPIAILPPALLQRRAIVYVRQSTQSQVMTNLESQRRQYDLVSSARQYGFQTVDVIDDDLGISASGSAARPGFERLVAAKTSLNTCLRSKPHLQAGCANGALTIHLYRMVQTFKRTFLANELRLKTS